MPFPVADPEDLQRFADGVRLRAVRMVAPHGFGYLGQALSSAEIMATLYLQAYRPGLDQLVCSPGHYIIAVYAAAAEAGLGCLPDRCAWHRARWRGSRAA